MMKVSSVSISACEDYYKKLHSECDAIMGESLHSAHSTAFIGNHNYMLDIEKWISALSTRPEICVLKAALREYQVALLVVTQGHYSQSFMALRLFLELHLSSINFSANELHLRMWLLGKQDINWNSIVSVDNGVFSKNFIGAFYEELTDEASQYRVVAEKVYRECSEYVHGNAYTQEILPDCLKFDERLFLDWNEKAQNIRLVTSFALCARYLKFLDKSVIKELEPLIIYELGHIPAIRGYLGGVTEA